MKKNQSGSSHVLAILVVILLGLISFASYKVYKEQNDKNKSKADITNATDKSESSKNAETTLSKTQPTTPSDRTGWLRYTNNVLGFSFSYPKTWGDIEDFNGDSDPAIPSRYYYSFNGIKVEDGHIVIAASHKSACPQGDGDTISTTQGWYEKQGKYYLNWCKYSSDATSTEFLANSDTSSLQKLSAEVLMNTDLNYSGVGYSDGTIGHAEGLINLAKNSNYLGVSLSRIWNSIDPEINNANLAEFKEVLLTVKVFK